MVMLLVKISDPAAPVIASSLRTDLGSATELVEERDQCRIEQTGVLEVSDQSREGLVLPARW